MTAHPMATPPNAAPALVPRIRSALFDIAAHPPGQAPRWTMWTITALFSFLVLWAFFAELDIVAVARGRLVPQTWVKIVQPAQAGIVRDILVREGDMVAAGQVLIRLDPTETTADRLAVERELAIQQLQLRRIDAELDSRMLIAADGDDARLFAQAEAQRHAHRQAYEDALAEQQAALKRAERELAAAKEVLSKLERTQPGYRRAAAAYEKLATQHLVSELQAEERRRAAIENQQDLQAQHAIVESLTAGVDEARKSIARLKSTYRSDLQTERLQVSSRIGQLKQEQVKANYQQDNLELRAPQAGIVKTLATTTLGAVVQPGTVLLSLVPGEEPLMAEVMIENQDIGFVRPGQPVRLKLATYPFQRYGMLEGVVKTVISDSQAQSAGPSPQREPNASGTESGVASTLAFKATIELKAQALELANAEAGLPLAAGMELSAEIVEGRRTVLQYLLSPVRRVASEAGMER